MRSRRILIVVGLLGVGAIGGAAFLWSAWMPNVLRDALPQTYVDLPIEGAIGRDVPDFNAQTWESVRVARVIDGDTVDLDSGERLRLIGIDAPERGACYADESAEVLATFVSGKGLRFEPGVNERDRYGRRLGYLYDGSFFINALLVQRGAAVAKAYPPDTLYATALTEFEKSARSANRGLWGLCGGLKESLSVDATTDVQGPPSPDCTIKGNISAPGERIYHVAGCGSYEQTRIDVRNGERWFCSEEEAEEAGWRKAKNCP